MRNKRSSIPRAASREHLWGTKRKRWIPVVFTGRTIFYTSGKRGRPMLTKCANPACSATFRYLHEGRLFVFEPKRDAPQRGPPADLEDTGRSHSPQYFWLCFSCCLP